LSFTYLLFNRLAFTYVENKKTHLFLDGLIEYIVYYFTYEAYDIESCLNGQTRYCLSVLRDLLP
jgi:hypothetical protein